MLDQYFKDIHKTYKTGDATEASYYSDLKNLLDKFLKENENNKSKKLINES